MTDAFLGDLASRIEGLKADGLRRHGVLVTAFSFPVVPRGEDRIRIQMSAAHEIATLDDAIAAFARVGHELGVIGQRSTEGNGDVLP